MGNQCNCPDCKFDRVGDVNCSAFDEMVELGSAMLDRYRRIMELEHHVESDKAFISNLNSQLTHAAAEVFRIYHSMSDDPQLQDKQYQVGVRLKAVLDSIKKHQKHWKGEKK